MHNGFANRSHGNYFKIWILVGIGFLNKRCCCCFDDESTSMATVTVAVFFKLNNATFFPDTFHSSSTRLTEDIRLLHHEMVQFRMHQLKASNESRTTVGIIPDCSVSSYSWLQAEGVVSASWSWFYCCFICSCTWRGRQNGKLLQFVSVNFHSLLSTSSSCLRNTATRMTTAGQGPVPNYSLSAFPPHPHASTQRFCLPHQCCVFANQFQCPFNFTAA